MRIVTWNCNLSLGKKLNKLLDLNADIAVIQECEWDLVLPNGYQYIWKGQNAKKGLGIISKNLEMRVEPFDSELWTYFIPVSVPSKSLRILATWAYNHRAIRFGEGFNGNAFSIISQLQDWLSLGPSMMVGDFNNSVIWDKSNGKFNFLDIDRKLNSLGLFSAYHNVNKADLGSEGDATFFHTKDINKPYHIDYCYMHRSLEITSAKPLHFSEWGKFSDHVPVVVDLVCS